MMRHPGFNRRPDLNKYQYRYDALRDLPCGLVVYGNGQSTYCPNLEEIDDTITVDSTTPFHQSSSAPGTSDPVATVVTAEKVNEAPLAIASEAPDYDKLVKEESKRAQRMMICVFAGILLIMAPRCWHRSSPLAS